MATKFPPDREADLVTSVNLISTKITATPTAFGLVALQASTFAALKTTWVNLYLACQDDTTRTPKLLQDKKIAKKAMIDNLRMLVRIIEAFPATTNSTRSELGLPLRDNEPTPAPVPDVQPKITVLNVNGRRIKIRLSQIDPLARASKPDGVQGASVFSFSGNTPPENIADWKFEGNVMKNSVTVEFPLSVPQLSKVWFTAFWFNRRGNSGPACAPVESYIGVAVPMAA